MKKSKKYLVIVLSACVMLASQAYADLTNMGASPQSAGSAATQQQSQSTQDQMQAEAQKRQQERLKIQKDAMEAIFKATQDVTNNKGAPLVRFTKQKSFKSHATFIMSAPMPDYKLFTFEEFLKFPVFQYSATHQGDMSWLYAPQGLQASRAGASGPDAVPGFNLRGWGTQASLGGVQGSLGGIYPLIADLYAPGREFNAVGAQQMASLSSAAGGNVPDPFVNPNGIMLESALRQAIADGTLFNLQHIQLVQLPGAPVSGGGLSSVALILPLSFRIFDFGVQDGDNITLTVIDQTGTRYNNTFTLTNAGSIIAPVVVAGQVELRVLANNEGSLSPNTGQINILSTVTSGNASQQFNLKTGQTGSMVITAAP
jgi:hypothetical protein